MTWLFVSLAGYFLGALAAVVDKLLLSDNRIGSPILYAFYTSLVSALAVVIIPFGFIYLDPPAVFLGIFSGVLFILGLVAFYEAVKASEVSRAAPLIGITTVVFIFLVSLYSGLCEGRSLCGRDFLALGLLVAGGYLLASRRPSDDGKPFLKPVLIAGALMAGSLLVLKETYAVSNFASGFVWSRIGMFLTGLTFLFYPGVCDVVCGGVRKHMAPTRGNAATFSIFALNKLFGGVGAFLIAYAVSLGPVTFVQGLSGVQFAFLFLMILPLSALWPRIFGERNRREDIIIKVAGIVLLAIGVWIAGSSGNLRGFL